MTFENDVVVVGGCGHVGLPLAISLAAKNLKVVAFDINREAVDIVNSGMMPFIEPGSQEILIQVLNDSNFCASSDKSLVSTAEYVVVVIGTPVDEHLNPDPVTVPRAVKELAALLKDGQHLVLRSTVYPGVTKLVENVILESGKKVDVSFCPERTAEGKAIEELVSLPQIVSGRTSHAVDRAKRLFGNLTQNLVVVTPEEAELAKLFTNSWRYIKFAAANQFFVIANDLELILNVCDMP